MLAVEAHPGAVHGSSGVSPQGQGVVTAELHPDLLHDVHRGVVYDLHLIVGQQVYPWDSAFQLRKPGAGPGAALGGPGVTSPPDATQSRFNRGVGHRDSGACLTGGCSP